jgi:regulatory protein YycI of two-component signal transduction system YycFG
MKKFILNNEHLIFIVLFILINTILFLIFFTVGVIYRVIRGKKKGWTLPHKKTW